MKSRSITIGIFLSAALVMTAGGLYWLASRAEAGNHQEAITLIRRIQQLESQWSIETARVRSDPLADFDALVTFIPRMERLKADLSNAMLTTPDLSDKLASDLGAYLSAIDAKEERIERFKTGYAVLRNSIRYLPLASASLMQQVEQTGGEPAFVRNISSVTNEITTYLATPATPEKERLSHVLQELGDSIIARHPALTNTIANFVAHGQVLLDKQEPTEEIFQEATSDRISALGERLIAGLEAEIVRIEAIVSTYERGILASGGALWLLWLAIALRLPRDGKQQADSRLTSLPQPPDQHTDRAAMDKIAAAAAPPAAAPAPSLEENSDLVQLTADLMITNGQDKQKQATHALEPTVQRVRLEVVSKQLTVLAERITSSVDILDNIQVQLFNNGTKNGLDADTGPTSEDGLPFQAARTGVHETGMDETGMLEADEELKTAAAVVASIRSQANHIVEFAQRLPSLSDTGEEAHTPININDCIEEAVDTTQAETQAMVIQELGEVPAIVVPETEVSLILSHLLENSIWAVKEHGQQKGVIRIETDQADDNSVMVSITDNGVGITREQKRHVFDPFYTSRDSAAGMGLATARHLVEKHGGSILINSRPGKGTIVRFTLPAETADTSAAPEEDHA